MVDVLCMQSVVDVSDSEEEEQEETPEEEQQWRRSKVSTYSNSGLNC